MAYFGNHRNHPLHLLCLGIISTAGLKRCLKLSMTDGIQRVFGMEYRPIKDLDVLAPSGLKVAICNVHVRHGLLMLVPEVIEVLGGMVEELEEARQRLVNEINKPPRGKRTRSGVVSLLETRATNAAWPREGVAAPEQADTSSRESMQFQAHEQGTFRQQQHTQGKHLLMLCSLEEDKLSSSLFKLKEPPQLLQFVKWGLHFSWPNPNQLLLLCSCRVRIAFFKDNF